MPPPRLPAPRFQCTAASDPGRGRPLAAGTVVRESSLRPLGLDANRRATPGARPAASRMNRVPLAVDRRDQVASHQVARGAVEVTQRLVVEIRRGAPGVEAQLPERLALIDVADPGADALLEQQFA